MKRLHSFGWLLAALLYTAGDAVAEPAVAEPDHVTLRMRATDGRKLDVLLVTKAQYHKAGRGYAWTEILDSQHVCTTPCIATLPRGDLMFQFTDVASREVASLTSTIANDDGVIDIDYVSQAPTRHRLHRNMIVGGVIGTVVGYSLMALIGTYGQAKVASWQYYSIDLITGLIAGGLGAGVGALLSDPHWTDGATLTMRPGVFDDTATH